MHYPSTFDPEMEFQIREKHPSNLELMQNMAITAKFNILEREEKLEEIRKDKAAQEKITSSELKLEMFTDTIKEMTHILGRKEEEYKVEIGANYSKQPVPFSWEEPN